LFVLKFIFSLASNPNIFLSTCKGGSSKQKENARPNDKKGKKKKKTKKEEENTQAENAHDENEASEYNKKKFYRQLEATIYVGLTDLEAMSVRPVYILFVLYSFTI
jgi:hypothetical protein